MLVTHKKMWEKVSNGVFFRKPSQKTMENHHAIHGKTHTLYGHVRRLTGLLKQMGHFLCRKLLVITRVYPLVIKHGKGEFLWIEVLIGKSPINGPFSIAIFNLTAYVVSTPLNNMSQLGWSCSQYMEKVKHVPRHQINYESWMRIHAHDTNAVYRKNLGSGYVTQIYLYAKPWPTILGKMWWDKYRKLVLNWLSLKPSSNLGIAYFSFPVLAKSRGNIIKERFFVVVGNSV